MDDSLEFPALLGALTEWGRTLPHGMRAGGGRGGCYSDIQLHTRPNPREPEVQITFQARLVDGKPVIAVSRSPDRTASRPADTESEAAACFTMPDDEIARAAGRDPAALCEACGALGTVGRAVRTGPGGTATETHQFCVDCWPEQSARYKARWEEEDRRSADDFMRGRTQKKGAGPGMWFQSATWHTTLDLVRQVERSMSPMVPPTPDALAQLAAQIRTHAAEREGEIPWEVEAFLQRYGDAAGRES